MFTGLEWGISIDSIVPSDTRFDAHRKFQMVDKTADKIISVLRPISDRILMLLTGNHEDKINRAGYFNPTEKICNALNVPYGGYSSFLKVGLTKTGETSYQAIDNLCNARVFRLQG